MSLQRCRTDGRVRFQQIQQAFYNFCFTLPYSNCQSCFLQLRQLSVVDLTKDHKKVDTQHHICTFICITILVIPQDHISQPHTGMRNCTLDILKADETYGPTYDLENRVHSSVFLLLKVDFLIVYFHHHGCWSERANNRQCEEYVKGQNKVLSLLLELWKITVSNSKKKCTDTARIKKHASAAQMRILKGKKGGIKCN